MAEPIAIFRLRPDPGRTLYVRAQVWPSKVLMHAYLRAVGLQPDDCLGRCTAVEVRHFNSDGTSRLAPMFAEVNLCIPHLGIGIVSHELLHATFAYARRCRLDGRTVFDRSLDTGGDCSPDEEWLCYAHGSLVSQFTRRAYEQGLYEFGQAACDSQFVNPNDAIAEVRQASGTALVIHNAADGRE